jgi:hypothetical protein
MMPEDLKKAIDRAVKEIANGKEISGYHIERVGFNQISIRIHVEQRKREQRV